MSASFVRVVKYPDISKCLAIENMSLGLIFDSIQAKGSKIRRGSGAREIICSPDSANRETIDENAGSRQNKARSYFSQAFGLYKLGVNSAVLEQILEYVDSGLKNDPTLEVKIALLFLKAIALYQSAEELTEWLSPIPKSPPREKKEEELETLNDEFTSVCECFFKLEIPPEYQDLVDKIKELKEQKWPKLR